MGKKGYEEAWTDYTKTGRQTDTSEVKKNNSNTSPACVILSNNEHLCKIDFFFVAKM